jgi:hypothetical protein
MSNLGRNFEILQEPDAKHRLGRFRLKDGLSVPIGAPLQVPSATTTDANGRLTLELATAASGPKPGTTGIGVYIWSWNATRGDDPALTDPSDKDYVPVAAPVQLVFGNEVKVRLINTTARTFPAFGGSGIGRSYTGRVMVAGLGATPTLAVDDMLTPGIGNDTDGYWAETADPDLAWLRITAVNATTGECEAQMVF